MAQTTSISHNFSLVADGHHRGAGVNKNKNIADGSGNLTFSSSLYFLFDKKEKMQAAGKSSMLLGVLNSRPGLDPLKKRLNSYGLFGKKIQNDPSKFDLDEVTTIFLWGQNITEFQARKIDDSIIALEKYLGDASANSNNFKQSPKFQEALNMAKTSNVLVVAHYDESFFNVNDDDPTSASLSMGYVSFGTGRLPIISSFDKDELTEVTINGKEYKEFALNPQGSISFVTTRSYLKAYPGGKQNLKLIKTDKDSFWSANLLTLKKDQLTPEFLSHFSQETIELMQSADFINFNYVFGQFDQRNIDNIVNLTPETDATMVFTGLIEDDIEDSKRVNVYEKQDGNKTTKSVTFRLRQGTFFTQRLAK